MANPSNLGAQLVYTGAVSGSNSVPVAYPATTTLFSVGACSNLVMWVNLTTDAASNFTGFGIKLQESYTGASGTWIDTITTDNVSTGTNATEHVVTGLTVGTSYWFAYRSTNQILSPGGCQIVFKGNGGAAKAGDVLSVYVTAW